MQTAPSRSTTQGKWLATHILTIIQMSDTFFPKFHKFNIGLLTIWLCTVISITLPIPFVYVLTGPWNISCAQSVFQLGRFSLASVLIVSQGNLPNWNTEGSTNLKGYKPPLISKIKKQVWLLLACEGSHSSRSMVYL